MVTLNDSEPLPIVAFCTQFGGRYFTQNQYVTEPQGQLHNHPSGYPTPSRADIEMTKTVIETARPLGISVHDHIIIGKNGHASLKGLQLI